MRSLRFLAVSVVGVVVDLSVATTLAGVFGLPLWLAGFAGFTTAAVLNYALHEAWTFRDGAVRASASRFLRHLLSLAVTLAVRMGAILALQPALEPRAGALAVLAASVALSFCASYLVARFWVFRAPEQGAVMETDDVASFAAGWDVPDHLETVFHPPKHRHALVIPVINEGERIRRQLQDIAKAGLPVDVVVADGGSTDGSLDPTFLANCNVRAVLVKTGEGRLSAQLRMAYAWCLRQGYQGIVTMDGNGKDGVDAVAAMVAAVETGHDYVQGSRYLPGGLAENTPLERTIANRLIHAPVLSLAGRHWFTDTTNGFRAYSRRYLLDPRVQPFRKVFLRYELLFYLTVRAGQIGMKVTQVPVRRSYPRDAATPTKISGLRGKVDILRQTFAAALGRFNP